MSKRDERLLLQDIVQSAEKILTYTTGYSLQTFMLDEKTIDAVVRNFEIVGEAANRLSPDFKAIHTNIDWQRIRGFRNRIVHDYFGIDYEIVWRVKEDFLPLLIAQLKPLI